MPAVRSGLRALAIAGLFLLHGARFLGGLLLLLLAGRPRAERQRWLGDCVLGLFRRLGATFIKVGQIMSTRPDLLPPHVIAALERLQDDVGPFPFAIVRRTLEAELGRAPEEI